MTIMISDSQIWSDSLGLLATMLGCWKKAHLPTYRKPRLFVSCMLPDTMPDSIPVKGRSFHRWMNGNMELKTKQRQSHWHSDPKPREVRSTKEVTYLPNFIELSCVSNQGKKKQFWKDFPHESSFLKVSDKRLRRKITHLNSFCLNKFCSPTHLVLQDSADGASRWGCLCVQPWMPAR